jgi:hypothetical protein
MKEKIIIFSFMILIVFSVYSIQRFKVYDEKIKNLGSDIEQKEKDLSVAIKSLLTANNDIKGYQDAEKTTTKKINELRKKADNCYNAAIPDDLLIRLREK